MEQSKLMYESLLKNGNTTSLVIFEGEQHGFRKESSIIQATDNEYCFYSKVLDFPLSKTDEENMQKPNISN